MRNTAEPEHRRVRRSYVVFGAVALAAVALLVPRLSNSTNQGSRTPPTTSASGISLHPAGTDRGSAVVESSSGIRFRIRLLDAQGEAVGGAPVTFEVGNLRTANTASIVRGAKRGDSVAVPTVDQRSSTAASATPPGAFAACPLGNPTALECRVVSDDRGYATSSVFTPTATHGVFTVTGTAVVDGHRVRFVFTVELPDATNPPTSTTTTLPLRRATTATTKPATPATPTTTSPAPPPPTVPPGAFTISGDITVPVLPGGSYPLDLSVTNPRDSAITIAAGGIAVSIATGQTGCSASENFVITHGLLDPITIPAGATRSLSQLGVAIERWPVFSMIETNTNQNACKNASIVLTYSGTATG